MIMKKLRKIWAVPNDLNDVLTLNIWNDLVKYDCALSGGGERGIGLDVLLKSLPALFFYVLLF